jgi:hypothetical protein
MRRAAGSMVMRGRLVESDGKGVHEVARRIDLMKPDERLIHRVGEREQRAGPRMAAVMRTELDRRVGAGRPLADGLELHRQLVAGRRLG